MVRDLFQHRYCSSDLFALKQTPLRGQCLGLPDLLTILFYTKPSNVFNRFIWPLSLIITPTTFSSHSDVIVVSETMLPTGHSLENGSYLRSQVVQAWPGVPGCVRDKFSLQWKWRLHEKIKNARQLFKPAEMV